MARSSLRHSRFLSRVKLFFRFAYLVVRLLSAPRMETEEGEGCSWDICPGVIDKRKKVIIFQDRQKCGEESSSKN